MGGVPCTAHIGPNGAGHYVKMIHNGIEYGDMQLICEAYNILRNGVGLTQEELHKTFQDWNAGDLGIPFSSKSPQISLAPRTRSPEPRWWT